MRSVLLTLLLCLPTAATAQENLRLLEVDDMSVDVHKTWHLISPTVELPEPEYYRGGVALNFDLALVQYQDYLLYWDNQVRGDTSQYRFRYVAWEYEMGFHYKKLSVFWHHRSTHTLDHDNEQFYNLEDRYGIRFHFIGEGR